MIPGEILALDFDEQISVRETNPITGGGAEHFGIGAAGECAHFFALVLVGFLAAAFDNAPITFP